MRELRIADKRALAQAPRTVTDGEKMGIIEQDDLRYKPAVVDLPQFNVPLTLPSLPAVADLHWAGGMNTINPSAGDGLALPILVERTCCCVCDDV